MRKTLPPRITLQKLPEKGIETKEPMIESNLTAFAPPADSKGAPSETIFDSRFLDEPA